MPGFVGSKIFLSLAREVHLIYGKKEGEKENEESRYDS